MMKAKERYLLLASTSFLLLCILFSTTIAPGWRNRRRSGGKSQKDQQRSATDKDDGDEWLRSLPHFYELSSSSSHDEKTSNLVSSSSPLPCRMESCFNFSRCSSSSFSDDGIGKPLLHYVYPIDDRVKMSDSYRKILNVLRASPNYTPDPERACLFVLSLDTLDRDRLSEESYLRNMQARLDGLPLWNGGLNHVVFNLYSGTYPDYSEELGFDLGKAILAKASASVAHYRPGFDISMPLFHPHHPERGGHDGLEEEGGDNAAVVVGHGSDKYFLAFKGKRYVYGIGSETRNSLYHLHNGDDVVLVTTCRHGKSWKVLKDERCDEDNRIYDDWDYGSLLFNSTFCLVPRGRRLGSFRFIETLQSGCVPVVLSNEWVLPFDEIVDWTRAAVSADERTLLQVPETLRSVPQARVMAMRQQTRVMWDRYFNSIEAIVTTTLKIIHERIRPHLARPDVFWNARRGPLLNHDWDFLNGGGGRGEEVSGGGPQKFTAVVVVDSDGDPNVNSVLARLVKNIAASEFVDSIRILWSSKVSPRKPYLAKLSKKIPLELTELYANQSLTALRFDSSSKSFSSAAILSARYSAALSTEEIDFAFGVWRHFPERIVGVAARSHYWDPTAKTWLYTSKWRNEYSIVPLSDGAFYHRHYESLLRERLATPNVAEAVERSSSSSSCADLLMNFVVSEATSRPPIKVSRQREMAEADKRRAKYSSWNHADFEAKQSCFKSFVQAFGHLPLKMTSLRLDPVLYKDQVSNVRKKYRKMELAPQFGGWT